MCLIESEDPFVQRRTTFGLKGFVFYKHFVDVLGLRPRGIEFACLVLGVLEPGLPAFYEFIISESRGIYAFFQMYLGSRV